MAKFKFRLQSVLGLKEKLEDLKKNEFGRAVMELERERQKLARLRGKKADCIHRLKTGLLEGIDPLEIQRCNHFINKLTQLIKHQIAAVKKAEEKVEKKRLELVEAMRERKTLDKLKENDFEEFVIEEKRAEQLVVDEIVSYRSASNTKVLEL